MKKVLLFTFLFFVVSYIFAEHKSQMPDFKYIVHKQMEAAEMKVRSYAKWMDGMREDTREMDNYDVRYYFIDIEIDFDTQYVEGFVESHLEIMENATSEISFHFTTDLDVDDILMNSQSLSFTHADDLIDIDLGYVYQSGDMIELIVHYSGYPQNRLNDGMKFQEHNGVPVVFTMVSPKGARKWWPCKDTPADKPDSLDIWITYPSQYICASNGTLQEVVNNGNGTSTSKWHYEGTQMMVDNYIYPEQYTSSVALYSLCEDMLTFYSDIYGEYPFITEKYGHATCTNLGALAMEHQTCTSFDSGYISDPAAESLQTLLSDPKYAGGIGGMTGILHTWTRQLHYHPHLHFIVPGGAFDALRNEWKSSQHSFLIPVKALSKIYRAKLRDHLKSSDVKLFNSIPKTVWQIKFITHSEPVGKGESAFKYLSNYVYRIAISNNRIVKYENRMVTFRYKVSKTEKIKYQTVSAHEFMRRFLQHVLPSGFQKVRYYGFMSSVAKKMFEKIKQQLGVKHHEINLDKIDSYKPKRAVDICPRCAAKMLLVAVCKRKERAPPTFTWRNLTQKSYQIA